MHTLILSDIMGDMNDLLKQDVFFAVTTVAVIVLTILFVILMVYLIQIIRRVNYITTKAREQTDLLTEELAALRSNIKTGFKFRHIISFFSNLGRRRKK